MLLLILEFTVRFLNGEYHGEEWPPSPARLFQALVAGARYRYRRGDSWSTSFDEALRWLERQKPPIIVIQSVMTRGKGYTAFRPANNLEEELENENQKQSQKMHPWYGSGIVKYLYESTDPPYETLRMLARSVISMGHGTDIVAVDVTLGTNAPAHDRVAQYPLTPASGGVYNAAGNVRSRQVPVQGWYDRLESNFKVWYKYDEAEPNVATATIPPSYAGHDYAPVRGRSLYWVYALGTQDGRRFSYPPEALVNISAWLRHAAAEAVRGKVSEEVLKGWILGHSSNNSGDERLSYIPLPSVGSEHSDGRIRRIMVASLTGSMPEALEGLPDLLDRAYLYDLNRIARARLLRISNLTEEDQVISAFVSKSHIWDSVTPLILHGHDFRNGKEKPKRTHRLLIEAMHQSGFEEFVDSFEYSKLPFNGWSRNVNEYSLPEHLSKWPRYHIRLRFKGELAGPLLIGIGRHYGLGLFARSPSSS
ncbi:MAG: type I-U CRISPR-associated protein Cas5/Cas6 [Nitrososphaerota archaeon]|nr:type I-U CRISPR-associated protein Cas5/Cas6 [Nitrososphaerota archaeon]